MNSLSIMKRTGTEAGLEWDEEVDSSKRFRLTAQDSDENDDKYEKEMGDAEADELDSDGDDGELPGSGCDGHTTEASTGKEVSPKVSKRKQTMIARFESWKASHPTCYSTKFAFFYSADNWNYNSDHSFMAQTKTGGFVLDKHPYRSAYHYYSYKRAKVIAQFDLKKGKALDKYDLEAIDVVSVFKGNEGSILPCREMKKISYGFEWTKEAEDAWEIQVRKVLYIANFYKFTRQKKQRKLLLATGDRYLIKACPRNCPCTCGIRHEFLIAMDFRTKWGRNLLGKTLMLLRSQVSGEFSVVSKSHPTQEQLNATLNVDDIDDGRNHLCEECSAFYVS